MACIILKMQLLCSRLTVLTSRGEISLPPGQPDKPRGDGKTTKKKANRIKALSPKYKKDEHLEVNRENCIIALSLSEKG